jgi:Zn finger protein HypA/HybF involved in hydrogenase expression
VGYDSAKGLVLEGLVLEELGSGSEVTCHTCNFTWTVKGYEKAMTKKEHLDVCPTCKGKGTVPGKKKKG